MDLQQVGIPLAQLQGSSFSQSPHSLLFSLFGLALGSLGVGGHIKGADRDPWIALSILPKGKEKHNELKALLKNILRSERLVQKIICLGMVSY